MNCAGETDCFMSSLNQVARRNQAQVSIRVLTKFQAFWYFFLPHTYIKKLYKFISTDNIVLAREPIAYKKCNQITFSLLF